jgi:purine-binding chemotaxis protein CheW
MDTTKGKVAEAQQGQYLGFFSGEEEYAISILRVKEILQYEATTRVPGTPPSIRGVINMRGSVVPVVDLAVRLGLPESRVSKRTCIVIVEVDLEGEPTVIGLMVDSVSQVIDLGSDDIQPPPPFGPRVRIDYLIGMGRLGQRLILLLDIDRVLSATEIAVVGSLPPSVGEADEAVDPERLDEATPEEARTALP